MVEKKLKEAINLMRADLLNRRNLSYDEGSVGITSLIYCPLKVEMGQKYPELKVESNAIDDGFIFENQLEPYIEKVFKGKVTKDANIPYELDGFKITGHPDFVIEMENKVIILEFKAPVFFFSDRDLEIPDDGFLVDSEEQIKVSESYLLQAKIQKFITEKFYGKPVEGYLFIKTTLQDSTRRMQKVYILRPVKDSITESEMKRLIHEYKTKKTPRYHWECSYCIYAKEKVCKKGLLILKMQK